MADAEPLHADRTHGRTHGHQHQAGNRTHFHRSRIKRSRFSYTPFSTTWTDTTHTELPHAIPLLGRLPDVPKWVVADRGYTSHAFRQHIWNMGSRPAIPSLRHEAPVACPDWIYNNRNKVERLWARLKEWRAVATRYEKTAASFLGVLCLAAALDWLKR